VERLMRNGLELLEMSKEVVVIGGGRGYDFESV
jgi:hypothetical protein